MATERYSMQRIARDGVWVTGPDGELIPDYESTFPEINEGQVVHGKVVRSTRTRCSSTSATSPRA